MNQLGLFGDLPATKLEALQEDLPVSLQRLADAGVTLETIRLLVEAFGGTRQAIPKTGHTVCAISETLGDERAAELARAAGGASLYVPACHRWAQNQRNRQILIEYADGMKILDLCRKHGITEARLRQILAG